MDSCPHTAVRCLNEYELIRKYQCEACGAVIMCACDERIGRKFLPHQLRSGVELTTQQRVSVTDGFQPSLCRECRGLPPKPHPKAEGYGRASKIRRYYWRELAFQTMERLEQWKLAQGSAKLTRTDEAKARKGIEAEVLAELKALHETAPKYVFSEQSQAEVISKYSVEGMTLKATYLAIPPSKSEIIFDAGAACTVEEFASRHFRQLRYDVLFVESVPFHVLFAIYMWLVIQDPADPCVRIVSFSDRKAFDERVPGEMIRTHLPEDFGSAGYALRRAAAIDEHFSTMLEPDALTWLFDYWLNPSNGLRQYLWANQEQQIEVARRLIAFLPPTTIIKILRHLIGHYWHRFTGWPDLLVYRGEEFFFAEVKSSGDKLSEDQKRWIRDNHEHLHLPFKLVKVHKTATATSG